MSRKIRSLGTLVLLILLAAGPAAALPLGVRTPSPQSALSGAWDWFSSLMTGWWEKEGSIMDPNGPPASNKEGSQMDPNGTPAPGEAGSHMDPDGLNATGCPTEAGSIMDPNGQTIVCQPVVG